MHLTIQSQTASTHKVVACVERDAATAQILTACCLEHLEVMVDILMKMDVDTVTYAVPADSERCTRMKERGWKSNDMTTLVRYHV